MVVPFPASSAEPVLVHGDLHHDNVLSSARAGWLATHGMRNEVSASERRSEGRPSMENRSFCVILRGLTTLDTRSAVADRAKNQNDRRSYEYGRPFLREYSDLCGADPLDA